MIRQYIQILSPAFYSYRIMASFERKPREKWCQDFMGHVKGPRALSLTPVSSCIHLNRFVSVQPSWGTMTRRSIRPTTSETSGCSPNSRLNWKGKSWTYTRLSSGKKNEDAFVCVACFLLVV